MWFLLMLTKSLVKLELKANSSTPTKKSNPILWTAKHNSYEHINIITNINNCVFLLKFKLIIIIRGVAKA